MKQIAIIGGGIVGLSCGVRLAEAGHKVTLFEQSGHRDAASWGNAGHIATEQLAPLASWANLRSTPLRLFGLGGVLDLPLRSSGAWLPFALRMIVASTPRRFAAGQDALATLLAQALPAWLRLAADIGDPGIVKADGHFVLWETPATATAGRASWEAAQTGSASLRGVDPDEFTRLRALTKARVTGAIRFSGSGQITDLLRLASALENALEERGGTLVRKAAQISIASGRAAIVDQDIDLILVAAGVNTAAVMAPLGERVPIIAERGYHIRAAADQWPADMPPVVFEDRSLIVTRYAGEVQASSFVEFNRTDAPPDPRKWARLEHHVLTLGLPISGPFTRWMGSRPTLPDYLPAIGRARRTPNLLYAFGHHHLGLTLAPITADLIAAMADDATPAIDIAPFDLARFGQGEHA